MCTLHVNSAAVVNYNESIYFVCCWITSFVFPCLILLNTIVFPYLSFLFIPLVDFGFRVHQCLRQKPVELSLSVICWKLLSVWLFSLPYGLQISSSLLNPTSLSKGQHLTPTDRCCVPMKALFKASLSLNIKQIIQNRIFLIYFLDGLL